MIFRRFNFLIILRVVLIVANVLVLSAIFGDKRLFFNQIILGTILIIQIAELIRFVNHTNRELTKLFYAIRHSDFSISFKQSILGKTFKELEASMTEIIQAYKEVKIEKEAQFHLLQLLINQLHVGIIVVENNERISLINPTAQRLVEIEGLKSWHLLRQLNPSLYQQLEQLGQQGKRLLEMKHGGDVSYISVEVSSMLILDKSMKVITLQNINSEIEQKEIEAWHKLIRILTHEIMNSVTPIASLTETMQMLLADKEGNEQKVANMKQDTISDLRFSLKTIEKRTNGLLNFVENYRKLTKVPKPAIQQVLVKSFLESVAKLMSPASPKGYLTLTVDVDPDIAAEFDPTLIEQVLINMITNSIHATADLERASIRLSATINNQRALVIHVSDNGKGISQKDLSEIFIPFYTTKKDGSGIGLSLSKQIMAAHGGNIKVKSTVGEGTTFDLQFPPQ